MFLEKSYTKRGGETILKPFVKSQNWAYLWINNLKFYVSFMEINKIVFFGRWESDLKKNTIPIPKHLENKTLFFLQIKKTFITHIKG